MADVTSNLLEHQRAFLDLIGGFDFNLPGKDRSLGRDMATEAAVAINERTQADQQDATGGPLKPNAPKYLAAKVRKHGVGLVGVLTGQMLSLESLKGSITVEPKVVTMTYGTGRQPTSYSTQGTITGKEPTDRQKAEYFTEGGRPFYELTGDVPDRVRAVASEALKDHLGGQP